MEQMIVTIKNGNVELEMEGIKGTRCVELTQAIEKLIGKVESRLFKKNFYNHTEIKSKLYLKRLGK